MKHLRSALGFVLLTIFSAGVRAAVNAWGLPIQCADPAVYSPVLTGVITPSVRDPGGTCIVALRPNAAQSVAPGAVTRFVWSGEAEPAIERLSD